MIIATTGSGFEAGDIDNLVPESIKSYIKNELCKINLYKFIFTFSENNVDFDYQDQTNDLHLNLNGSIKK